MQSVTSQVARSSLVVDAASIDSACGELSCFGRRRHLHFPVVAQLAKVTPSLARRRNAINAIGRVGQDRIRITEDSRLSQFDDNPRSGLAGLVTARIRMIRSFGGWHRGHERSFGCRRASVGPGPKSENGRGAAGKITASKCAKQGMR